MSRRGFENTIPYFPKTAFPYQRWATLKYTESYVEVDPAIGSCGAYIFRANDVYDPNYSGVGHQPLSFDQYMAMYNRFCVYASKIKVTGFAIDTETNDLIAGVAIMDTNVVNSQTENYLEQPLTDWRVIPAGAGANTVTFSTAFSTKAFSGTIAKTDDLLFGSSGASPSKLWYYHVFCGATKATENPGACKFSVEVEYKVRFFDPKTVNIS